MRRASPLLSRCAPLLLMLLCSRGFGESVARSDPQTEGEKRLLEWDTTRKFVPSKSSFNMGSAAGKRVVPVTEFATRSFSAKNAVTTASFYTPEFLSPTAGIAQKSFSAGPAYVKEAAPLETAFGASKAAPENRSFSGSDKSSSMATAAPDGSRPYLGPEADKMKQKYTPGNAPKGGVITGHQLSIEEVRAILNRNK